MATLKYKSCWQAPGYRSPVMVLVDEAGREYRLRLMPADLQRVINECADSVKQIGAPHPPIDWAEYPTQIYWPQITPWQVGPPVKKKDAG